MLVYKVLENWYVTFAELTPKLIVGILVFSFLLPVNTEPNCCKTLSQILSKSQKESSLVTLISVFRFLIMLMGTFISLEIMGFSGFSGNLSEVWELPG
jgi:small conductance mechanosensitive channel